MRIPPEKLRKVAGEVVDLAASYKTQYVELLETVDTLTTTAWQGSDADLFCEKVREFEVDLIKMKELMDQYAEHLRKAADDWDKTIDENRSRIASLPS